MATFTQAGPSTHLDWTDQKIEEYLLTRTKALLLDQHLFREQRPRYPLNPEGPQDRINRFDQGVREGEIKGLLNALLVLRDPNYFPAPGFDNDREDLRRNLFVEAKAEKEVE